MSTTLCRWGFHVLNATGVRAARGRGGSLGFADSRQPARSHLQPSAQATRLRPFHVAEGKTAIFTLRGLSVSVLLWGAVE